MVTRPQWVEKDLRNLKIKIRKRVTWYRSKGVRLGELSGCLAGKEATAEKGQGWFGLGWKEDQEGGMEMGTMSQLWWRPSLAGLQGMEGN